MESPWSPVAERIDLTLLALHVRVLRPFGRRSATDLKDFDVFGASSRTARDASDPLFPKYPNALLPQKFRLQARHRLTKPLRVTALDCRSGQPVLFYVKSGLNQPPETPQRFRHNGVRSVTLFVDHSDSHRARPTELGSSPRSSTNRESA